MCVDATATTTADFETGGDTRRPVIQACDDAAYNYHDDAVPSPRARSRLYTSPFVQGGDTGGGLVAKESLLASV